MSPRPNTIRLREIGRRLRQVADLYEAEAAHMKGTLDGNLLASEARQYRHEADTMRARARVEEARQGW